MKKKYVVTKSIFQVLLYIVEVFGVAFLITLILNHFKSIESIVEFVETMILSFTIYQVVVLVILTNLNDIKKDSYLAFLTTLKLCKIYLESKDKNLKMYIIEKIDKQLDLGTFNIVKVKDKYEYLKNNLELLSVSDLDTEIVLGEHDYEMVSLNWRFSFLLTIFK